jgi:hypothetical protein
MTYTTFFEKMKKSKYHLLFSVVPLVIGVGCFKAGIHFMAWEVIPEELASFFPSIFTGIIFVLGFLLAGVLTDYKESEKIPNEMAASLYAIWQEADYIKSLTDSTAAKNLMDKLRTFVPIFKLEYFVRKNNKLQQLIEAFSSDIIELGKQGAAPNYLVRMKTEQANLKKAIDRISVIKNTNFVPSVFVCIQAIIFVFLFIYCLLKVEPWWGSMLLVCIFACVIFAIVFLIQDMEDPFEYDGGDGVKSDEVSLDVLENLHQQFNEKEL